MTASPDNYDEFTRSTDGTFNKSIFLSVYSDLIIFVEDTDRGNIYETIFQKLLDESINFDNIYLSGGKKGVKEYYELYLKNPTVPSIFLVDLDYDDIHQHKKINDVNFIYLDRYSIENYFIDENVAGNFLNPRLQIGFDRCLQKINLHNWLDSMSIAYKEIIVLFLTIQSLELGIVNTKLNAQKFLKNNSWEIDSAKVASYHEEASKKAQGKGLFKDFCTKLDYYDKKLMELYKDKFWTMIPGKQLLTLFWRYLVDFCPQNKKTVFLDDFYHLCADHCDMENFSFLKDGIEKYLNDWHLSKNK
ncbi:DUF4435 domain-containing protein [Priestia megaterium]|nr:DUF4435 domain-containing protein [Priestia megaterium]